MPEENEETTVEYRKTNPVGQEVEDQYQAAYVEKQSLGLHDEWAKYEEYYHNRQVTSSRNTPGSSTNIIRPNIESMVADLTMEPLEVLLKGWNRTDHSRAPLAQRALEWVWEKNRMIPKRDSHERTRVKLGTSVWKVYFDGQGKGVQGMPMLENVNPANFFPDPKVKSSEQLYLADFVIHAVVRPVKYIKRVYGDSAENLVAGPDPAYDPEIFEDKAVYDQIAGDKALVLERWTIEGGGDDGDPRLRKVVVSEGLVLYDSDEDEDRDGEGYYPLKQYPFVVVPMIQREGMLWGGSMVETLIPTQDVVNELDDHIRINTRLMGNIQKVISISSGINPKRWTNEAGINIPARDIDGWRIVQPNPLPPHIMQRRLEARDVEAPLIASRPDVVEGRRPGSLRAASAILSLQEVGMKQAMHLKTLSEQALADVFSIILDYITEYWSSDQEIDTDFHFGNATEQELMGDLSTFKSSDMEVEIFQPGTEDALLDEEGLPITRQAEFDITVNIGGGFINNKAFIYQAIIELTQYGVITPQEARRVLKEILSFPIIEPDKMEGQPIQPDLGAQAMPGAGGDAAGGGAVGGMPTGQPGAESLPPEALAEVIASMGGMPQ